MSMYVPMNEEHKHRLIMEVAQARNENPNDVHIKLLTFGHLFKNDVARTAAMAYVRSGKACLSAEGIKSLVFKSGKMLYIRYIEQSAERCIIEVKRADFPSDIPPQRFEYTWEDAVRAGNSTQLNYKKMPAAMLTARCWMKMARDYFSDVVAGYYSVDELMDNENMNDHERAMISAQSMGEDINLSTRPQPQRHTSRRPQAQPAPQPQPAPKHIEIDQSINSLPSKQSMSVSQAPSFQTQAEWDDYIARNPLPAETKSEPVEQVYTHRATPSSLDSFKSVSQLMEWCEWNFIPLDEANQVALAHNAHLDQMTEYQRSEFFYSWILQGTLRNSNLKPDWWRNTSEAKPIFDALRQEFPAISDLSDRLIGKSLGRADFWEAAKVSAHFTDAKLEEAKRVLSKVLNEPDINAASYLCSM